MIWVLLTFIIAALIVGTMLSVSTTSRHLDDLIEQFNTDHPKE